MIDPRDIQELADTLTLRPTAVEKDYVLGWLLAGIANDPDLSKSWVFKGGTCLKKIYFETFRFSEDLDFTVTDSAHLDQAFLLERFQSISAWVYDRSGVEIPADRVRFETYSSPRGGTNVEGRVYYRAALRPPRDWPKIKLDLTADEVLVDAPEQQRVRHPYSDEPEDGIQVRCYSYPEVFAEKIRALHERGRPRDLYDVINLFRRADAREAVDDVRRILALKCEYKGIEVPTLANVASHESVLRAQWENMLAHQLQALPPFESYFAELPAFFGWLREGVAPVVPAPRPMQPGERLAALPQRGAPAWGLRAPVLETIRFAATNRLCVDLDYRDEQDRRSTRLIEPESLRETSEGNFVLHAERADGGGHRRYRIDRILGARVTDKAFVPKHAIELTPPGFYQPVPPTERAVVEPSRPRGPTRRRSPARRTTSSGLKYIYECPLCHKRFTRTKRNRRLNKHKNPSGYPCAGHSGLFVGTKW